MNPVVVGGRRINLPPNKNRPCMCTVCTCGQHHCPGRIVYDGSDTFHTTYGDTFQKFATGPPTKIARILRQAPGTLTRTDADHYVTSNHAHYPLHDGLARPQSCKPKRVVCAAAPFYGTTTTGELFPAHAARPFTREKGRVPQFAILSGPREPLHTTNRDNDAEMLRALGQSKDVKPPPIRPVPMIQSSHVAPFDGKTTYTEHYPPKAIEGNARSHSTALAERFAETRDFTTTQRAMFAAPRSSSRPLPARCPATYLPHRPPSSDGHMHVTGIATTPSVIV